MADSDSKPYFEESWFEALFAGACLLLAYTLFQMLMPPVEMSSEAIQSAAMAKLFAEGRFLEAFTRFNLPPVYPLLMSLVIQSEQTTELPRLVNGFLQMNQWLYLASIGLVYAFVRRQIRKPYLFIIAALYAMAPSTLAMAWDIGPQMAYVAFSLAFLVAVDYSMSKESAEGGQFSRGELLVCGSLLALSILTRQIGYTLLLAFFFVLIKRAGLKKSAIILAVTGVLISPFIGRDLFHVIRAPQPYVGATAQLVDQAGRQGVLKTVQTYTDSLMRTITQHAVGDLSLDTIEINKVPGQIPKRVALTEQPWGRWILGALAVIGALYGLYLYTGIGSLYLCTYLLTVLIVLPKTGISLAPVLPLMLFYLYFGVMRFGEWMKRLHLPVSKILAPALTVWILLCTVTTHLNQWGSPAVASTPATERSPQVVYMSTAKEPQNRLQEAQKDSAHRRAMDWLETHTQQDARIAVPRPEAASLLAGAEEAASEQEHQALQKELGNFDYLVEENAEPINSLRRRRGALTSRPGLHLVYEDVPGKIRIWQINPAMR